MERILFVCSYNLHRSPVAEIIFNQKAEDMGLDFRAESAGISAIEGKGLKQEMVFALQRAGYNHLRTGTSRKVTPELLQTSRLVLTFEDWQTLAINRDFMDLGLTNVDTFHGFVGEKRMVDDPEKIIHEGLRTWVFKGFRYPVKRALGGGIHPTDYKGVANVFDETVNNLEFLIDPLIVKLKSN